MSLGRRMYQLEMILEQLLHRFRQIELGVTADGTRPGADEISGGTFFKGLDETFARLGRISAELVCARGSIDFRDQLAGSLPRQDRFRERQAVNEHRRRERRVFAKTDQLRRILERLHTPPEGEINKDIMDVAEYIDKMVTPGGQPENLKALVVKEAGVHIRVPDQQVAIGSLTQGVAVLYVLYRGWRRKRAQGKDT